MGEETMYPRTSAEEQVERNYDLQQACNLCAEVFSKIEDEGVIVSPELQTLINQARGKLWVVV